MLNRKNFPGLDGFAWWTGVVESRQDPLKIGRAQIRAYGWHTENKALIPTEQLFWAQPIFPTNVSNDTYVCKEGDTVLGFFMDGDSAQFPFFFGRIPDIPVIKYSPSVGFSDPGGSANTSLSGRPTEIASRVMIDGEGVIYTDKPPVRYPDPLGEPTTSRFARNENIDRTALPFIRQNILPVVENVEETTWKELPVDYAAKYPYNDSKQSESGHYLDYDDTPKKERICLTHRTGTMMEMTHEGHIHHKDMKDSYHIVHGKTYVNYRGRVKKTAERKTGLRNKGKVVIEINNDLELHVAGNVLLHSQKQFKIVSDQTVDIYGNLGVSINSGTAVVVNASEFIVNAILISEDPVGSTGPNPTTDSERQIPYLNEDGRSADDLEKEKEKTFDERMAEWLAMITAPGAGGAGACWKSDAGNLHTHHATGPDEVLTYLFCKGATYVDMDDGCTGKPTRINIPSDFVCPI